MTIKQLHPDDLQTLLMDRGYDLGSYGADGIWGSKTSAAIEGWFGRGEDLAAAVEPLPPPGQGIVPDEWLPDCKMNKLIFHWSAGAYTVSAADKEHYHIIVGGDLKLVRGDYSIKANVSTSDGDGYAAHTSQCNTGAIGIAVACMANAVESPFNPGSYPLTKDMWLTGAQVAAECCRKYALKVTPTTVLSHGEVQKNLGISQSGKWDVGKLPWQPSWSSAQVYDAWRSEVSKRI
jgi:hypothetical protein